VAVTYCTADHHDGNGECILCVLYCVCDSPTIINLDGGGAFSQTDSGCTNIKGFKDAQLLLLLPQKQL